MKFIGFLSIVILVLLNASLSAEAQQGNKIPRISYLSPRAGPHAGNKAFQQGLRDLGWIEGQNITIEYRWAAGQWDRLPSLAEELVRLKLDIIVVTYRRVTQAAKNATDAIPIVMTWAPDAVDNGLLGALPTRAEMSQGCRYSGQLYIRNCWN